MSDESIVFQMGNAHSHVAPVQFGDMESSSNTGPAAMEPSNTRNPENTISVGTRITNNNDFITRVKEYAAVNKPHLCILTPCYGSVCYVNFVHCLMQTNFLFQQLNIPLTIEFCKNDSLVSRARNNLVAKAMSTPSVTHILFIDNDITWDPADVLKLLISDKSLIGGVYPLKKYNWEKIVDPQGDLMRRMIERKNNSSMSGIVSDIDFVQNNLLKYNTNFLDSTITIQNNLTKVRHIATGFMMFKRATIEMMAKAYPTTKYTDDVGFLHGDENKYAYALFDCGVEDNHYYSEDWLFCHRWSKMGGNIYMDVSINLKHTGLEDYSGSFISSVI
jgi:hypothetical protein